MINMDGVCVIVDIFLCKDGEVLFLLLENKCTDLERRCGYL